jgi:hypothetical protein
MATLEDLEKRIDRLDKLVKRLAEKPEDPTKFVLPKSINSDLLKNLYEGTGSPENVVHATKGALYHRIDGGAGTCLYVKETATGNTGWVAK